MTSGIWEFNERLIDGLQMGRGVLYFRLNGAGFSSLLNILCCFCCFCSGKDMGLYTKAFRECLFIIWVLKDGISICSSFNSG